MDSVFYALTNSLFYSLQVKFLTLCLLVLICWFIHRFIHCSEDVKELSWMSHRVIRFWFLFNFLFISAFFDILASLSISRVFSSDFSGRHCLDMPRTLNTSAVNQAVFCYYFNIAKIIIEKKILVLTVASKAKIHFFEFI